MLTLATSSLLPHRSDRYAKMNDEQKSDAQMACEREYYTSGTTPGKRSLAPHEYKTIQEGDIYIPLPNKERLENAHHCLEFIRKNTDIPVLDVVSFCEKEGAC
ncbi:hypothetical protein WAI453_007304 [Rhynchosporium graminicola]